MGIKYHHMRNGPRITPLVLRCLEEIDAGNRVWSDIARKIGCTRARVCQIAQVLGVKSANIRNAPRKELLEPYVPGS